MSYLGRVGIPIRIGVVCATCGQPGHISAHCGKQNNAQPIAYLNTGNGVVPVPGLVQLFQAPQAAQACHHCGNFGHKPGNCTYAPTAAAAVLRCRAHHQRCNENHSRHFCDYCNDPDSDHRSYRCPQRAIDDAARAAAARAAAARAAAFIPPPPAAHRAFVHVAPTAGPAPCAHAAAPAPRVHAAAAASYCTGCGTPRRPTDSYCGTCGHPL